MKVNSKTTKDDNAAANLICHQGGQRTVNGIIGNTRRGIRVDQTLDPDSNNPIANKPVSTALTALAGKIDAALQKPTGLTKTELVGVGTNGQENIEIGDNLTLANGKLSATGGGGGGAVSPILNLIGTSEEASRPVPRESITEEEKTNIEKGLYSTVMFVRGSDEILGYLSMYFPGNAINMDGILGFSAYNLSQKAGGNFSIVSSSFYILDVDEEKNPDGTYPISYEEQLQIPFSITSESIQLYRHFITLAEGSDLICLQLLSFRNKAYDNINDIQTDILENTQVACTGVVKDSGGTFATPMYLTTNTGVFRVYYFLPTTGEIKSKAVDITPGRIKVSDWNTII